MTAQNLLDTVTLVFAFASDVLCFMSSRVDFPFGFDMGAEIKDATRQVSKLSARCGARRPNRHR